MHLLLGSQNLLERIAGRSLPVTLAYLFHYPLALGRIATVQKDLTSLASKLLGDLLSYPVGRTGDQDYICIHHFRPGFFSEQLLLFFPRTSFVPFSQDSSYFSPELERSFFEG
jgi:hypothetical protein